MVGSWYPALGWGEARAKRSGALPVRGPALYGAKSKSSSRATWNVHRVVAWMAWMVVRQAPAGSGCWMDCGRDVVLVGLGVAPQKGDAPLVVSTLEREQRAGVVAIARGRQAPALFVNERF